MSKATERQIQDAKLHATVWEDASSKLGELASRGEYSIQRTFGTTVEPLNAMKWLAGCVAGGYRKIVNGQDIAD